jgi:hypothetical protein
VKFRIRIAFVAALLFALALGPLAAKPSALVSWSALRGLSGRLRSIFALPQELPARDGSLKPGVYRIAGQASRLFHLIVLTPFSAKVDGRIGAYRLGRWPFEGRSPSNPAYADPRGFIQVTPENFATRVSEHFTLGQFITKDQFEVWPKYVVLDRRLLDKLELTIEELARRGHPASGLFVMSGFRTPQYNESGGETSGRSAVSRHLYGDAADVYPDEGRRGLMDDLNGDGRVDLKDAAILAAAADAVEERHPELAGGIGVYPATSEHGPFVHIDARGKRARWGG